MKIESIHIENYKSIKDATIELGNINILIGGNGVGKSNFISLFGFFKNIISRNEGNLSAYIIDKGGVDKILHFGRKVSKKIDLSIQFERNKYACTLIPNERDNNIRFGKEEVSFLKKNGFWSDRDLENQTENTFIYRKNTDEGYSIAGYTIDAFNTFKIYHFHDASSGARVKQFCNIHDNRFLFEDAGNLAAFLYWMQQKHPTNFAQIEDTLKIIAPYFYKFNLAPNRLNESIIQIEWNEKGSDILFNAHDLSDGTLRMLCLLTLFLQPKPPEVIIIDEPELGLHPQAIHLLASIIQSASIKHQVIIATQSVTLVNQFTPEDIIIVNKENNSSVFNKIDEKTLEVWMQDYAMGELWEKNIIGGR